MLALSRHLFLIALLVGFGATGIRADDSFARKIDGVVVRLLAVSDGAGAVWNPAGGPLSAEAEGWLPNHSRLIPRGEPSRNGCFLISVSGESSETVSASVTMSDSKFGSYGERRGRQDGTQGDGDKVSQLFRARGVFAADVESTTIEVLIGSGDWRDEGAISSSGNSSYSGTLLDGGRHGDFLLQATSQSGAVEQVGDEERNVERVAVVSMAMHDSEDINDDYRLIARDVDGNVIHETASRNASGFHMQMVLECRAKAGVAPPAKFAFQQRPKNAVRFENVRLAPPVE